MKISETSDQRQTNPELYFDSGCLLCSKWADRIQVKTAGRLDVKPLPQDAEKLTYQRHQQVFYDSEAVEQLLIDYPEIAEELWLLPGNLRKPIALKGYRLTAWFKDKWFKKKCRECPKV